MRGSRAPAGPREGCGCRPSVLPGAEGMQAVTAGVQAAAVWLMAVLPKLALGRNPQAGDSDSADLGSGSGFGRFNKPPT